MYFRKVRKSTLSLFDDKRCYIKETKKNHGTKNHVFEYRVVSTVNKFKKLFHFNHLKILFFIEKDFLFQQICYP